MLHDDQMRKKYDEMRRIGISQDQYAQREAYEKHAKSAGFTLSVLNARKLLKFLDFSV